MSLATRISTKIGAALLTLALLTACNPVNPQVNGNDGGTNGNRPTLGELVFRVIKTNLQTSETCPAQYVTALDTHHTQFVTTFDYVFEKDLQADVPELLGDVINPLVQGGQLPEMVDTLAEVLALLVSDEFDAERETLTALTNLAEAETLLERSSALELVSRIISDPSIGDQIHALAQVAQQNDGVTYVLDDILDVVARVAADEPSTMCSGLVLDDIQGTLLRTDGFVPDTTMGSAVYMARPDANGNPRVLPRAGGALPAPFVDANDDQIADVNADNEPVDASGAVIDLPYWGSGEGYDAQHRAVDAQGMPIYEYYDVKQSALSHIVSLGLDALESNVHRNIDEIADAVLGQPQTCAPSQGATCRYYPSANNPLADLAYLVLELLDYTRMRALVDTMYTLLTADPDKVDDLLVAMGDVVRALEASTLSLTDPALIDMGIGILPLVESILETSNSSGIPTARLLVDLIQEMGAQKYEIAPELNSILKNQRLGSSPVVVNYAQPRFYMNGGNRIDNRSGLEQLVELFQYADCGNALFSGQTWSYYIVGLLADMTPQTVSTIVDLLDGILGVAPWAAEGVLTVSGCSSGRSAQIVAHLPSLEALVQSGGLDWILPLANVFEDNGELRTLINIFGYIAVELRRGDTAGASTNASVFRQIQPPLSSMIDAGAVTRILEALDVLYTIPAADGDGNSVDLIIDATANLVNTRTVPVRGGTVSNSSLAAELLKSLKTMVTRLNTAGASDELMNVVRFATSYLKQTEGTGASRRLANRNLRPLVATLAKAAGDAANLPFASWQCYVGELQTASTNLLGGTASSPTSRNFATIVRVLKHVTKTTNVQGQQLESWLESFIRPMPASPDQERLGILLLVAAGAITSDGASGEDLSAILRWLGTVSGQQQTNLRSLVAILDEMLVSDEDDVVLTMMRTMVRADGSPSGEAPIVTMGSIFADVANVDATNMCSANDGPVTVTALETLLDGVLDFLSASNPNGIQDVWDLVGTIAPEETPAPSAP